MSESEHYVNVPCGKCHNCLMRRAQSWVFRLQQHELHAETACFVTYTYDSEHVPISENGYQTLHRKHHTLYMKRLRKQLAKEGYITPLKYYLVGEYGSMLDRPHYHAILYNLPTKYINNEHKLTKIWKLGRVQIDLVTNQSIAYVCGYVSHQKHIRNLGENDDRVREFSFMSQGLGADYLTPQKIKHLKNTKNPYLVIENGQKITLPRYYRDKVFNEHEKWQIAQKAKQHIESKEPISIETKNNILGAQKHKQLRTLAQKRTKL